MPHKITAENDSLDICDNCLNLMTEEQECKSKGCNSDLKSTLKLIEQENGSIRVEVVDIDTQFKDEALCLYMSGNMNVLVEHINETFEI